MTTAGAVRAKVSRARPGAVLSATEFQGSRSAVETALARLAGRGEIVRVRKGLYFKAGGSRFGPGKPSIDAVVYQVCGTKGVGPAGWTASRSLGISTQVPARAEFAVVGSPPTGIDDVRFHSRRNLARLELRPLEVALLETLREWPLYSEVEWEDLVRRIEELAVRGEIRLDRAASVGAKEHAPKLRERLRMLVDDLAGAGVRAS